MREACQTKNSPSRSMILTPTIEAIEVVRKLRTESRERRGEAGRRVAMMLSSWFDVVLGLLLQRAEFMSDIDDPQPQRTAVLNANHVMRM